MRAISSKPVSKPHTKAWLAFEKNLDSVSHMVSLGSNEISLIYSEGKRLKTKLGDPRTKGNVAKILRLLEHFSETFQAGFKRYKTLNLWQVVLLVTCVEAYLQDLLTAAASVGPELMSESQQSAPYTDVIAAKSLEELANELRSRWARGWLSDGGPTRWISRLKTMGARGYPDDLATRLELIWGIRHAVVHINGIAKADFIKRHPGIVKAAGERLRVGSRDFEMFLGAVKDFMEPTEKFFLARYPSLFSIASTELRISRKVRPHKLNDNKKTK